jgi:hypothetical protein
MAIRAGSASRVSTTSCSSDSRPWNICGDAGNKENDPELENKLGQMFLGVISKTK